MEPVNKADDFLSIVKFDTNKLPVFKEEKNLDWVVYGTEGEFKNRYPDFLLQCYNRSGKHKALIDGKIHYICGNGFEIDAKGLTTLDAAKFLDAVNKANKYGETISDIAKKVALDRRLFGGCYIQIVFNKSGKGFDYYHMDYSSLRLDKEEESFWYSDDWSKPKNKQTPEDTNLEEIPIWTEDSPKKGKYILWYKQYSPGLKWYPLPEYIGIIPYIECDYEISNYHLSNIRTNFNIGTIISFNNGKPDEATKAAIEEKLKEKFQGTDKAGSLLINFSVNKENAPTVEHLAPSELDKQFEQLNKQVEQEIFIGHRITSPMLFGVKTEGQLGGRDEISEAYEIFKSTYIQPEQKIIENIFNEILELKGFSGRVKLKEVQPLTEKLSEETLKIVLTPNELRELVGYDKIEGGDKLLPAAPEQQQKPFLSNIAHHFEEDVTCSCKFKKDDFDKTIDQFKKFAKPKEAYEILFSKQVDFLGEAFNSEKEYFKDEEEDYILPEVQPKGIEPPTKKPDLTKTKVMYSYEPRPGLKAIIPTTRDFCIELLDINGLYSRVDIQKISDKVGWDVWKHRGGFWHQKNSNYTRDYCRHVWQQHIVKLK